MKSPYNPPISQLGSESRSEKALRRYALSAFIGTVAAVFASEIGYRIAASVVYKLSFINPYPDGFYFSFAWRTAISAFIYILIFILLPCWLISKLWSINMLAIVAISIIPAAIYMSLTINFNEINYLYLAHGGASAIGSGLGFGYVFTRKSA